MTSANWHLEPYEIFFGLAWLFGILWAAYIDHRRAALEADNLRSLARLGALALFLIGAATFALELLGRQAAAKQKLSETQQMIEEIQRVLGRFNDVTVSFKLRIPAEHWAFREYRQSLDSKNCFLPVPPIAERKRRHPLLRHCFPNQAKHPIATHVLGAADLQIELSKLPLAAEKYHVLNENLQTDLSLLALLDLGEHFELEFEPDSQTFVLRGLKIRYDVSEARRTDVLISTKDLSGARMFVSISNRTARMRLVEDIHRTATLESLSLHFSGAPDRHLDLFGKDLERHLDKEGLPFYVYDIAKSAS